MYIRRVQVHTLDLHFQNTPGLIAAYIIESAGELALIETGPGYTLETLRAGIRGLGLDEKQIRHVFVTHIHLDHAGAAGWWAQQGAQAQDRQVRKRPPAQQPPASAPPALPAASAFASSP